MCQAPVAQESGWEMFTTKRSEVATPQPVGRTVWVKMESLLLPRGSYLWEDFMLWSLISICQHSSHQIPSTLVFQNVSYYKWNVSLFTLGTNIGPNCRSSYMEQKSRHLEQNGSKHRKVFLYIIKVAFLISREKIYYTINNLGRQTWHIGEISLSLITN